MKKLLFILCATMLVGIVACEKEPVEEQKKEEEMMEEECNTEGITYNGEIQGIISGCTGSSCHGGNTSRSMANFEDAKAYAELGRLLGALNHDAGFSPMPKGGAKLDQCKIDQVKAWVDAGYPEG